MTAAEARAAALSGWNLRCNLCGEHPAEWIGDGRPGWGALALCPRHKAEYREEERRHALRMSALRTINFEQLRPSEITAALDGAAKK